MAFDAQADAGHRQRHAHHALSGHQQRQFVVGLGVEKDVAITEVITEQLAFIQLRVHEPGAGVMHMLIEQADDRQHTVVQRLAIMAEQLPITDLPIPAHVGIVLRFILLIGHVDQPAEKRV